MTPDELPADMEGLIERIALPWIEAEEMSVDPEELAKAGQALRDLLKAYQEQRRALEEANARIGVMTGRGERCPQCADTERDCANAIAVMAVDFNLARAALNQKGDER